MQVYTKKTNQGVGVRFGHPLTCKCQTLSRSDSTRTQGLKKVTPPQAAYAPMLSNLTKDLWLSNYWIFNQNLIKNSNYFHLVKVLFLFRNTTVCTNHCFHNVCSQHLPQKMSQFVHSGGLNLSGFHAQRRLWFPSKPKTAFISIKRNWQQRHCSAAHFSTPCLQQRKTRT